MPTLAAMDDPERPTLPHRAAVRGLADFWLYAAGPLLGAALAASAYGPVRGDSAPRRAGV